MQIPERKLEDFAQELVDKCLVSRKDRVNAGALWRQYYLNGTNQNAQAPYNLCFPHIDRTSSYLFSPSDINFRLHSSIGEAEKNVPADWQETWMEKLKLLKKKPTPLQWPNWQEMRQVAAHYLNSEFFNANINFSVSQALDSALIKNSAFVKVLWENDGLAGYVIQPESMGVYREDIVGLHRQEAFVHTSFITFGQFLVKIKGHPQEAEMIKSVQKRAAKSNAGEKYENDFLHQMVIGGIATAGNPSGNIKASTNIFGTPIPKLSPKVQNSLLVCHEIWIKDDDREDYTTIQMIEPDIIIEGKLKHRNICGIKGEQPFRQICANPIDQYFWGMSELMPLRPLQDMVNVRVSQINRALRRRARPSYALSGYSGDTDQAKKAMDSPDGLIVEGQGAGMKVEKMQPDNPTDMYQNLTSTVEMFDNVAGFTALMQGKGEAGVRSQVQADAGMRSGSPRMRDRALMVERQCGDIGDLCFKYLQAKVPTQFTIKNGESFLLAQIPDDTKIMVDSHSSSPAFSEDLRQLGFGLKKMGVIDNVSLLEMLNPPNADELIQKARAAEEAQQKLIAQHPELLSKGKSHH
jgi:hypothetical protein